MKLFIKFCNTNTPVESRALFDRMLVQLTQCEFSVKKSQFSTYMNSIELDSYEETCHSIKKQIDNIKIQIQAALSDLRKAKIVRRNKMEYDLLAKVINSQPDRKKTLRRLKDLQNELYELEENSQKLERKLDMRRKQFYVLMSSASMLKQELNVIDSDENMDNSLDMDDLPTFPMETYNSP